MESISQNYEKILENLIIDNFYLYIYSDFSLSNFSSWNYKLFSPS